MTMFAVFVARPIVYPTIKKIVEDEPEPASPVDQRPASSPTKQNSAIAEHERFTAVTLPAGLQHSQVPYNLAASMLSIVPHGAPRPLSTAIARSAKIRCSDNVRVHSASNMPVTVKTTSRMTVALAGQIVSQCGRGRPTRSSVLFARSWYRQPRLLDPAELFPLHWWTVEIAAAIPGVVAPSPTGSVLQPTAAEELDGCLR